MSGVSRSAGRNEARKAMSRQAKSPEAMTTVEGDPAAWQAGVEAHLSRVA
jgi:hypothetical protein